MVPRLWLRYVQSEFALIPDLPIVCFEILLSRLSLFGTINFARSQCLDCLSLGSFALLRLILRSIFLCLAISISEIQPGCAQEAQPLENRPQAGRLDFDASTSAELDDVFDGSDVGRAGDVGSERLILPDDTLLDARLPDSLSVEGDENQEFSVGVASPDGTSQTQSLGGPMGGKRSPFSVRSFWIPSQSYKNLPGQLGLNGTELELGFPLHIDPSGIWLGMGGIQHVGLDTSSVFPDSGLEVPDQFWDIQAGVMHIRNLSDDRKVGGMLRVGSPSDQPFGAWRDLTVTLIGFMTIPSGDCNAWNLSLFYSPTGQITFPIPGVAYSWRPNDQFQANIGIPFSVDYRPTETLSLSASYMPLNNVQFEIRQVLAQGWSVYGGYRTVNDTFLLSERESNQERTYLFDQRLTLGLQCELGKGWSVDVSSAYVFDRQFFQAEKFSGERRDELLIDSGVAGLLQLSWTR